MPVTTIDTEKFYGPDAPFHLVRLDKTRPSSQVFGDRMPDDPHYNVAFMQGELPFDTSGQLVRDNGQTVPFKSITNDGKDVIHRPLYDERSRDILLRRLNRLRRGAADSAPATRGPGKKQADLDGINLEMWLRGDIDVDDALVIEAATQRYSKKFRGISHVVDFLVYDEKLIEEDQVDPQLKALIANAA